MREKKRTAALPTPPEIDEVLAELSVWRQSRQRRSRIPEAIWTSAARVARSHGVAEVARALRLDYYALRRRLAMATEATQPDLPAFVELRASVAMAGCDCQVELERPDGSRMRIQLRSPGLPDLAALSQSFWRGAR